jgi:hypothetical protein
MHYASKRPSDAPELALLKELAAERRGVDLDAEPASRDLILDVEHAEAAPTRQRVRHEVEYPDRVGPSGVLMTPPRRRAISRSRR